MRYAEQFRDELSAVVLPDGFTHDYSELIQRLADLIEPSEPKVKCVAEVKVDGERLEKLVHDAAVELVGIDRDALLALADEMCDAAWRGKASEGWTASVMLRIGRYARRIREALGVTDG